MYNKFLIPFIFSFLFLSQICFTQTLQWFEQNSGSNRELTDVCFVDQDNGWISGYTGTMLHTTDGGDTWNTQNIPPSNAYYSVFFTDLLNGWATGYDGRIVHTTDGGQTWVFQTAPVNTDYYKVYFVNSNIGWIAGGDAGSFPTFIEHRVILNTTNGGASWSAQYSQSNKSRLNSIIFVDQNNGYAAGESGIIMKTTDGGSNWSEQEIPSFDFSNIFFTDNLTGWVTGYFLGLPHHPSVFKTTDGGSNWVETQFGTDEGLSDIYFVDNLRGWAVGGNTSQGIVYYTSDGGTNWELQTIPSVNSLYSLFFCDENCGWAVGHLGTIISTVIPVPVELTSFSATRDNNDVTLFWQTATETNNLGFEILRSAQNDSWEKIGFIEGQGTTTEETDYSYVDENLQPGNYLYKLAQIDFDGTRDESDVVKVEINSQPSEYTLLQNYPNPFNPNTTIKYSIPTGGIVNLRIYNAAGEEIRTLVNEYKAEGTHEILFDAEELTSGIYFYKISAGEFNSVKKMVLLK